MPPFFFLEEFDLSRIEAGVERLRDIVREAERVFRLPEGSPAEAKRREYAVLNLRGCRDFVLEDLAKPLKEILTARLGRWETAKLVDTDEVSWAQDRYGHLYVEDKEGLRQPFLTTLDNAALDALLWLRSLAGILECLDGESCRKWTPRDWTDTEKVIGQEASGLESHLKTFYTLALEPEAWRHLRMRRKAQKGHERTHGTAAEKKARWATYQRACDDLAKRRPDLTSSAIAQRVAVSQGCSVKTIKRRCKLDRLKK